MNPMNRGGGGGYGGFMARGGIGRPPMPMHGYGPGPGYPHPRMPHYGTGPPMGPMGYEDYGPPRPRMRQGPPTRERAPAPPIAGQNPERPPHVVPPKPSSIAHSDLSSSSKVESLISEDELEPQNDCEILIMDRSPPLNKYAEALEIHIRTVIGLSVDLMYPNDDVKIAEFLIGLGKRGTKLAIVLREENESHRSLTLHMLKPSGVATVHRNVPLHTAYDVMKKKKPEIKRTAVSRLPGEVRKALDEVLNDGLLKDKSYQACIRYLSERWKKQMEYEERTEYDEETGIFSQEEMERRIERVLGVDRDDGTDTEQSNGKLARAVEDLINKSGPLRALHSQNENNRPQKQSGPPPRADSDMSGGGPPRPKFPKAGGSVSSSNSKGSASASGVSSASHKAKASSYF